MLNNTGEVLKVFSYNPNASYYRKHDITKINFLAIEGREQLAELIESDRSTAAAAAAESNDRSEE
jgi:hypothetical protein